MNRISWGWDEIIVGIVGLVSRVINSSKFTELPWQEERLMAIIKCNDRGKKRKAEDGVRMTVDRKLLYSGSLKSGKLNRKQYRNPYRRTAWPYFFKRISPFFRCLKGLRPRGEGGESGLRRKQMPQYANGMRINLSPWKTESCIEYCGFRHRLFRMRVKNKKSKIASLPFARLSVQYEG